MSIRNAVCLFAALALFAGAANATTAIIEQPVKTGVDGSGNNLYDVVVKITTDAAQTLSGFELGIEFDSACMAADPTAVAGADIPASGSVSDNVVTGVSGDTSGQDKTLKVLGIIVDPGQCLVASTTHHVATLQFTLLPSFASGCGLSWNTKVDVGNPETSVTTCAGIEIPLVPGNCTPTPGTGSGCDEGKVCFCESQCIDGNVAYWSSPATKPIPNTVVEDATATPTTTTNAAGDYQLCYTPFASSRTITARRATQTDDRDAIGTFDVIACRRDIGGFTSLSEDASITCDIDQDLDLQIDDCIDIGEEIIEIPTLAAEWVFHGGTAAPTLAGGVENPTTVSSWPDCTADRDWTGYFLGDCNGSWPTLNPKPQAPGQIPMNLELAGYDAGEVTVNLTANVEREELHGVVFTLSYDASALEYVGMGTVQQTRDFMLLDNPAEPGLLRALAVGWKAPARISGGIVELRFRVLSAGTTDIEIINLSVNDREPFNLPTLKISGDENHVVASPVRYFLNGYPNPFNPTIKLEFGVPANAGSVPVDLRVLDVAGRVVRNLVQSPQSPGFHSVVWNGLDNRGQRVDSGIYFVQARMGDWSHVQKVTVLK